MNDHDSTSRQDMIAGFSIHDSSKLSISRVTCLQLHLIELVMVAASALVPDMRGVATGMPFTQHHNLRHHAVS